MDMRICGSKHHGEGEGNGVHNVVKASWGRGMRDNFKGGMGGSPWPHVAPAAPTAQASILGIPVPSGPRGQDSPLGRVTSRRGQLVT